MSDERDVTHIIELLDEAKNAAPDWERMTVLIRQARVILHDLDARTGRRDPSVRNNTDHE